MTITQHRNSPFAHLLARCLQKLCSDLKAVGLRQWPPRYSVWRQGPVAQIKPKLVNAMDAACVNLFVCVWASIWRRMRSFWSTLKAAELIDVAFVRQSWLDSVTNGNDSIVTLDFVNDSTWQAIDHICAVAEISKGRLRSQLRNLVQWAHTQWTTDDDVECSRNIYRWWVSEKVVHHLGSDAADLKAFISFIGCMKVTNAGVEGKFSEVTARKSKGTVTLADDRLCDMIVLKQLGKLGPDPASTPFQLKVDGAAHFKCDVRYGL